MKKYVRNYIIIFLKFFKLSAFTLSLSNARLKLSKKINPAELIEKRKLVIIIISDVNYSDLKYNNLIN